MIKEFMEGLKAILEACNTIEDAGGCNTCPLGKWCLKDDLEACERNATEEIWQELLDFAEDVDMFPQDRQYQEDNEAFWEDYSRSRDREENW